MNIVSSGLDGGGALLFPEAPSGLDGGGKALAGKRHEGVEIRAPSSILPAPFFPLDIARGLKTTNGSRDSTRMAAGYFCQLYQARPTLAGVVVSEVDKSHVRHNVHGGECFILD